MAVAVDERAAVPTVPPADAPAPRHWTDIVAFVVFALVVVGVFWYIHRFAVNIIYFDQWADINVIMHAHEGTLSFATLWNQHNENRILFPNLIVLALASTTHFNIVVEDILSGFFVIVTTALLIVSHRRRSPTLPWILYCPVALVFLSFAPLATTLFGFLVSWYLVMVALAVTLFLLDRATLTWMTTAGRHSRRRGGQLFLAPGAVHLAGRVGVALPAPSGPADSDGLAGRRGGDNPPSTSSISTGPPPAGHASSALSHPGPTLRFFLESLGNVTGSPAQHRPRFGQHAVAGPGDHRLRRGRGGPYRRVPAGRDGGGALGVALICLWAHLRSLHHARPDPTGVVRGIAVRHLRPVRLGGGIPGPARPGGRSDQGAQGTMGHRPGRPPSVVARSTAVAAVAMGILLSLFVLQVLLGFTNGLNEGRNWLHSQSKVADVTANINAAPDQLVQTFSPYVYSTEEVRRLAAFASADRLSLFATSLASTDRRSGLFAGVVTKVVRPRNGAVLSGKALLDATTASTTNVTTVQFRVTGNGLHDALVGHRTALPLRLVGLVGHHDRGRRHLPITQRRLLHRRKDGRESVDYRGGPPPGPASPVG